MWRGDANKQPGEQGFTLIELVVVIVILSIIALTTTQFIVDSSQSYIDSSDRVRLISSGRIAAERISRQLRNALPNSIRVSATGNCIEFMPIIEGLTSVGNINTSPTSIETNSFTYDGPSTSYAVVGAQNSTELYVSPFISPGAIVATTLSPPEASRTNIPTNSHQFSTSSAAQRVYIVGNPERFCVTGGVVNHYSAYGIDTPAGGVIDDTAPTGAVTELVTANISTAGGAPFVVSGSMLNRNAVIQITLDLARNQQATQVAHSVQVRNVP